MTSVDRASTLKIPGGRSWLAAVCSAGLCLLVGCGDGIERVPITGLLTADGKPVSRAVVQLLPLAGSTGPGALGMTDAEGKFEVISSRNRDEGVPAGEYIVRVSRMINPDGNPLPPEGTEADYPDCRESVPLPFSGAASTLKVTITEAGGEVKVNLPVKLLDYKRATKGEGG